jgi:hypothetical protein
MWTQHTMTIAKLFKGTPTSFEWASKCEHKVKSKGSVYNLTRIFWQIVKNSNNEALVAKEEEGFVLVGLKSSVRLGFWQPRTQSKQRSLVTVDQERENENKESKWEGFCKTKKSMKWRKGCKESWWPTFYTILRPSLTPFYSKLPN